MKIYVAIIRENQWEVEPEIVGCYSTEDKAKDAILDELRTIDEFAPLLSLEIYDSQKQPNYIWWLEECTLDK